MGKKEESVFFFYLFSSLALLAGIQGSVIESSSTYQQHLQKNNGHHHHHRHRRHAFSKLFVFGDSYADTGNIEKELSPSWQPPYGITFPGKPSGRFSDGRVLTDYVASFIGIKPPIPYVRRWKKARKSVRHGVNFAYGGTGVFDTLAPEPNMTTQIHFFKRLIHHDVYTKADLARSLALVSLAGNDYGAYIALNGSAQSLPAFITSVINQLALDLKSIHDMGVKKIAVTALEPLGCLPRSTVISSYKHCNGSQNMATVFHNFLLQKAVAKLNKETNDSAFHILDLYDAFISSFKRKRKRSGRSVLKPCCVGVRKEFSCGSVNAKGVKRYKICRNPESSFFWDNVHPSQAGWRSVYSALKSSLWQLSPTSFNSSF